jgi:hypothetical protein
MRLLRKLGRACEQHLAIERLGRPVVLRQRRACRTGGETAQD